MPHTVSSVLAEVIRIAPSLHKAGTFSTATLEAIVRHASMKPVQHSAETGSGASTLLFSHVSGDHTVFAIDAGTGSIRSIENSPLLRREVVTFVEGPTQLTLPVHKFAHRLQLALIDGPHGYPFPDLEYYYLYPHLDPGALLIVDDIHIPTVTNMLDFLSADEMFDLQEVVETTAFFRRTGAPTFSPTGDGWWLQRYNYRAFDSIDAELFTGAAPERVERPTPFYLDRFGSSMDPLRGPRIAIGRDEEVIASGWALDVDRRQPADAVDLVIDGRSYRAVTRVPRAVVATAHGDRGYFKCGFNARFPPGAIGPGTHVLEIRIVMNGGREYCSAALVGFEVT